MGLIQNIFRKNNNTEYVIGRGNSYVSGTGGDLYPDEVLQLIRGGAYYTKANLLRWDSIPVNAQAKARRSGAVASAKLYLRRFNRDGSEVPVDPSISERLLLNQIQSILGQIEMHRMIAGRALLHYTDEGFVLIPFNEVFNNYDNIRRDGSKYYGTWRRLRDNINVELTEDNTIRIGINELIPPQASAIMACVGLAAINEAVFSTLHDKVDGLSNLILFPGATDKFVDSFNQQIGQKLGGEKNKKGLFAIGSENGGAHELKIAPINADSKDVPYSEGEKEKKRDIASAYQVPAPLIGDNSAQTYNNIREAKKDFFNNVVVQQWERIVKDITAGMIRLGLLRETLCVGYDYAAVPGLQPGLEEIASNIGSLVGKPTHTVNEVRDMFGLPPVDGGDELAQDCAANRPIPQTDEDQRAYNVRLDNYIEQSSNATEVVKYELYRLNELYGTSYSQENLVRTFNLIKNDMFKAGDKASVFKLARLVQLDFGNLHGFKKYNIIAHTGDDLCDGVCLRLAADEKSLSDVELLNGCRCLIEPKI